MNFWRKKNLITKAKLALAVDFFIFCVPSPVLPVERPGHRSRSEWRCWVLRSVPHTWRDRWAAPTAAGARRRRRLLSAGIWRLRFRSSEMPLGHLGSAGHTQTHTHTRRCTHARSCSAVFGRSGGNAAARRTHALWGSEADHMIVEEEEWRLRTPCTIQIYITFTEFTLKTSGYSNALTTHRDDMIWYDHIHVQYI